MLVKTSCFSPLHIFIARINSNDYKVQPVLDDEEFYDVLDAIGVVGICRLDCAPIISSAPISFYRIP